GAGVADDFDHGKGGAGIALDRPERAGDRVAVELAVLDQGLAGERTLDEYLVRLVAAERRGQNLVGLSIELMDRDVDAEPGLHGGDKGVSEPGPDIHIAQQRVAIHDRGGSKHVE